MTNFNSHGVQSHNASNRNLGISSNRIAQETNDKLLTSHEKLDTLSTKLNAGLPSALTGGGHLKVCIQELGNVGSGVVLIMEVMRVLKIHFMKIDYDNH